MKTFIYYTNNNMAGRLFAVVDNEKMTVTTGNTASTAFNYQSDVTIEVRTKNQIRKVVEQLGWNGYVEVTA